MDLDTLAKSVLAHGDAILAVDRDGLIRFWNEGAVRVFGHSETEARGRPLDMIVPDALRARHTAGFEKTVATGETRYGAGDLLAVPALRKDGARISIEFSIVPLRSDSRALDGIAAVIRDVTPRFEEMRFLRRRVAELEARLAAIDGA